jgi:hypothetical protein
LQKKCISGVGQYFVPLYVSVTPVPKVRLGTDTVFVKIWIPYETADLRFPDEKINLRYRKPVKLHAGVMTPPIRVSDINNNIAMYEPFTLGFMKVIPVKGKQLQAGDIAFEFEAGANAWEIEYGLVSQKPFDGVYLYRVSITQFKDRCVQVDPSTILVNTPTNHHLVQERFDWAFSPNDNDVLFYVEE